MNATAAAVNAARTIALSELREAAPAKATQVLPLDHNPVHHIKARLQVCVGEATLSVGDLMAAREHQVITLNRRIDQPVDLLLEGSVVARGQLVAVDEQFAVCITELPIPLKP